MTSSEHCVYCDDRKDYELWVQCDECPQWVHVKCVPIEYISSGSYPTKSSQILQFICYKHGKAEAKLAVKGRPKKAVAARGKAKGMGQERKLQRYRLRAREQLDYIALNEGQDKRLKHQHPHIEPFLDCFQKWECTDGIITSQQLHREFNRISSPKRVVDPQNSGIRVPDIDVAQLTKILGEDHTLDVMDVQSQQNERWTMKQWNDYYTHTNPDDRDRIRNVISLEISHVPNFLTDLKRPQAVEDNDLVDLVWPDPTPQDVGEKPKVKKYILMSVGNAYTDFHLDFAGTSVYYSIVKGAKKFLLFPPTEYNLKRYKEWCDDDNQPFIFLGNNLEQGLAFNLKAGDLFLIPCGFIHAVYTPEDSFIVGGNFLSLRDLSTHLQIVKIEQETKVSKRFTFPKFDIVMGLTCEWILADPGIRIKRTGLQHITCLLDYLKDSKIKYKPMKYHSKSIMLSNLEKLTRLTSNDESTSYRRC
ncbi:[Histone H3]-lysine-36 demethylase Ecym_4349 [Eremothecium cymbalariae DBVPG|uniref:JmjC domain-containing histone demethylation protein 1 n=1 Tax=Eremothecium cymbalariae (strain CBS 270.75 / DBVPG 7215 / KCTC 17166 / NRRL Y-17582) TaxID=931890 RepID=G8JTQ7_ERECY|nr:hypothetical protein Ecym_4349 [Eremothecium cymbalariae DBVPG\